MHACISKVLLYSAVQYAWVWLKGRARHEISGVNFGSWIFEILGASDHQHDSYPVLRYFFRNLKNSRVIPPSLSYVECQLAESIHDLMVIIIFVIIHSR